MSSFTGPLAQPIALCRQAQAGWAALPWSRRRRILKAVTGRLVDRADALASVISKGCGKTLTDALSTEVVPATLALTWYLDHGSRAFRSHRVPAGTPLLANKQGRIHYRPYGVVGIVSPWNYPFAIPFSEVVMALAAGNGVVLKVATSTRDVGRALVALFEGIGLPDHLLVLSELPGAQAGPALIDGGVDKLFFTGSVEVGRQLMREASQRLLPVVLELGGNDAAVVLADADLALAVRGLVWAGLSNAGQSCGGAQRILVHRSVYEDFCGHLARQAGELRIGDPGSFDTDIGALVNAQQKAGVEAQVRESLALGARLLFEPTAGHNPPDRDGLSWLGPRILVDVPPGAPVWKDEVFGPVMAVVPFDDEDEAVRLANDSLMGLTSSVWSRDHRAARALAGRIRAGAVLVDDHLMSHGLAETPWGGFGHSGTGRTHGFEGLREMVQAQVVVDDLLPFRRGNPWWHPHSEGVYRGLRALQRFHAGPGLLRRLAALPALAALVTRYWKR